MASQTEKLNNLLSDGLPHRTDEIVDKVYGHGMSLARVGARVYDLKKKYGIEIKGWHDPKNPALYWYQLKSASYMPPRAEQKPVSDRVSAFLNNDWGRKPEVKLPSLF